jgi:leader peptidase (prepilin peptidase)/N-methyltransferase
VIEDLRGAPAWLALLVAGQAIFLIAIAVHDVRYRRVPNVAIYPAIGIATVLAFLRPDGPWFGYIVAGAGVGLLFVLLAIVSNGGMGMGDAKLATFIGLIAGWPGVLVAAFVAFAVGAVAGLVLVLTGRVGRREPVPFAPALAVGAMVAALAGRDVVRIMWPGLA